MRTMPRGECIVCARRSERVPAARWVRVRVYAKLDESRKLCVRHVDRDEHKLFAEQIAEQKAAQKRVDARHERQGNSTRR